jgi:hypothetical protein
VCVAKSLNRKSYPWTWDVLIAPAVVIIMLLVSHMLAAVVAAGLTSANLLANTSRQGVRMGFRHDIHAVVVPALVGVND